MRNSNRKDSKQLLLATDMGPSSTRAALAVKATGFCEFNITMTTPKIIATASVRRIQSRNDKERFMVENSFAAYSSRRSLLTINGFHSPLKVPDIGRKVATNTAF
jgi:hypothetical protein